MNKRLRYLISEAVRTTLNEFIAGGNDYRDTYKDYKDFNKTNEELDSLVRELHTICQYHKDIFDAAYNGAQLRSLPRVQANPQQLKYVSKLIGNIYSLMSNRNNLKGDRYAMTYDLIKQRCFDSLSELAQLDGFEPINTAASRALRLLQ